MYTCPVCGYDKLRRPPDDDIICPSCGTQFGYTDATKSHAQLRQQWLSSGAKWYSRVTAPPRQWNAYEQLQRAGLIDYSPSAIETYTEVGLVELGEHYTVLETTVGEMRVNLRDYAMGKVFYQLLHRTRIAPA